MSEETHGEAVEEVKEVVAAAVEVEQSEERTTEQIEEEAEVAVEGSTETEEAGETVATTTEVNGPVSLLKHFYILLHLDRRRQMNQLLRW